MILMKYTKYSPIIALTIAIPMVQYKSFFNSPETSPRNTLPSKGSYGRSIWEKIDKLMGD